MTDEQTAHMQHPDQMDCREGDRREYYPAPNAVMSKYVETIQKVSKGTHSDLKVFKESFCVNLKSILCRFLAFMNLKLFLALGPVPPSGRQT